MATESGRFKAVLLRDEDDVAVAPAPIPAGGRVEVGGVSVQALAPIALGHKLAVRDVAEGSPVRKYGQVIGFASKPIRAGDHVHVQNLRADLFERDYAYASERAPGRQPEAPRTFRGYLRPDGRVGTRNYIAVVSTVNCSASTSRFISERFRGRDFRRSHPNIDGVFAITHKGGCGLPFEGSDHQILERVLAGFVNHPNVAAYVLVGLGCEGAYAQHLIETQHLRLTPKAGAKSAAEKSLPPRVFTIQEEGGVARTVEAAVAAVEGLLPAADAWRRTEQPASKLCLALECGGSDGNSGVTANPALGVAADLLIAQGGAAVLGETTEIYGAEHLLTRRAVSAEVGRKLVERIKWWEWYTGVFGAQINNNPSPGNKAGGLSTIYEKSLGALAKAGTSPLVDVIGYAEPVRGPGLFFMDTPGYDPVCTTGLVAGGANVLVFTTGRGSVLGLKPTPCVKVATNTPMYEKMKDDMDLDAGTILAGESVESVGRRLFEQILDVAGGEPTRSERVGMGEDEFVPWNIGPTL
ncbi:UxaA family hydrolase [Planctomyces sp. SH-PL62]|uniref:UxaA family hydrolase n=1 Tax=Planctomyces sp. SH-PL62 TaxID=1636152 RepID=UPI00078BB27E|nr:altronate dehydratase family protein [Planctomyces sp. SH-PL62]AMV38827.1 Altronate dehydratase [Planctomyces sp. SH-PL62]